MLAKPTIAKSVEFELIKAVFTNYISDSTPDGKTLIDKSLERLRNLIKSPDPNLNYLGLDGLQILIT